jgi:hypothetical protein
MSLTFVVPSLFLIVLCFLIGSSLVHIDLLIVCSSNPLSHSTLLLFAFRLFLLHSCFRLLWCRI